MRQAERGRDPLYFFQQPSEMAGLPLVRPLDIVAVCGGPPGTKVLDARAVYSFNSLLPFTTAKMKVIDHASRPHGAVDEHHFVLPALMQPLLGRTDGLPIRLYRVTFGEGARTNWHKHDDVQVLYGLSGTCVVVDRQGNELPLHSGDVVVIDADEEHWHGAAPGMAGEHLAINAGAETTWLESSG